MFDKHSQQQFDDDDDSSIFVEGALLELDELDSAIDALARDEMLQAEEARQGSTE